MISGRFWSVLSPSCFPDSFWMSFCLLITPDPLDIHQEMHIMYTLFFLFYTVFPCFFLFRMLDFLLFSCFPLACSPRDSWIFLLQRWFSGRFWWFYDDFMDFRSFLRWSGFPNTWFLGYIFDDFESFLIIFMDFQDFKSFLMSDMCLYECYGMF